MVLEAVTFNIFIIFFNVNVETHRFAILVWSHRKTLCDTEVAGQLRLQLRHENSKRGLLVLSEWLMLINIITLNKWSDFNNFYCLQGCFVCLMGVSSFYSDFDLLTLKMYLLFTGGFPCWNLFAMLWTDGSSIARDKTNERWRPVSTPPFIVN